MQCWLLIVEPLHGRNNRKFRIVQRSGKGDGHNQLRLLNDA
jgi:hypothetical protein